MYSEPVGYFLTFTVRGSWCHGDVRGSWQRNGIYVTPGESVGVVRPARNSPHFFTADERQIIGTAIKETCLEQKWVLHEYNVLSNHVHVVLSAKDVLPEKVMRQLKTEATKQLKKSGHVGADEKIWTQHGSTKYLFNDEALWTTREYVRNQ